MYIDLSHKAFDIIRLVLFINHCLWLVFAGIHNIYDTEELIYYSIATLPTFLFVAFEVLISIVYHNPSNLIDIPHWRIYRAILEFIVTCCLIAWLITYEQLIWVGVWIILFIILLVENVIVFNDKYLCVCCKDNTYQLI